MKNYVQTKKYANKLYADSEIFSTGEWVADRILYLLSHGHNVEGVVDNLSERHTLEVRYGNVEEAQAIQAALTYIREEKETTPHAEPQSLH